jgi:hypothetical protein
MTDGIKTFQHLGKGKRFKPTKEAYETWASVVGESYGHETPTKQPETPTKQSTKQSTKQRKTIPKRIQLDFFKAVGEVLSE